MDFHQTWYVHWYCIDAEFYTDLLFIIITDHISINKVKSISSYQDNIIQRQNKKCLPGSLGNHEKQIGNFYQPIYVKWTLLP